MSGDYIHNPPNLGIPNRDHYYYYVITFANSKTLQMKGLATIYRRKTLEMLLDLINDLNQVYMHNGTENQIVQITTQNDPQMYFRVIYTNDFRQVMVKINPQAYIIKYAWQEIPNANPIWPYNPPPWHLYGPWPPPYPGGPCGPIPPPVYPEPLLPHPYRPYPPYASDYKLTQQIQEKTNQTIQRFSERQN